MAKATRKTPYAAKTPKANAAIDAQTSIARFNRSAIQSAFVVCIFAKATVLVSAIQNCSLKLVFRKLSVTHFASVISGCTFSTGESTQKLESPHYRLLSNDAIVAEFAAALTLFSIYQ
jgi:hypothetical protein